MKFLELPEADQFALMHALHRWVYPLYFVTGVEDYEHQFVGTAFLFEFSGRKFFVFTEHQYEIAKNCRKCVFLPDRTDGFLALPDESIIRFPEQDLAVCELQGNDWLTSLEAIPPSITSAFKVRKNNFLYAITGYRQVHNRINYDEKVIMPDYGSILTAQVDKDHGSLKLDISKNYAVIGRKETDHEETSMEARTQGLSGSPIFGFQVESYDLETKQGMLELEFLGIVTHVAENLGIVYATHSMDFLGCLDSAYGIFDKYRETDVK